MGRVTSTINPAFGMEAINLVLRHSGHRHPTNQKMTLDVDYERTHADIKADLEDKFVELLGVAMREYPKATERELVDRVSLKLSEEGRVRNYEIALPIEEIQSVNIFDMDIYKRFFAPAEPESFVPPPKP